MGNNYSPVASTAAAVVFWLSVLLISPTAASSEDFDEDLEESGYRYGFELKGHWRDSDAVRFPVPFNFPAVFLPAGETRGFLETVEAGSHGELSVATLWFESEWGKSWAAKVKFDFVDRYDRNPTSEDREWDIDEAWLRWGHEVTPGDAYDRHSAYVKLGKFPKFERQDDRHLESYGLLSTAFNRFEDVGVEIGIDLRWLYFKVSFTQGNPFFFRDPNALAGDNGIPILEFGSPSFVPNPDPELKTGFPIFYDADTEDLDFENPEAGLGLGLRFSSATGFAAVDILAFHYERDLADEVDLGGTFYGGDLDLLRGPFNSFALPISGREKKETGVNVWLYAGDFTLFGQYVDQETAGLPRTGWETEVSYAFELPLFGTVGGRQLFDFIQPAIRYSKLDPDFGLPPFVLGESGGYPAPSVVWDWEKIDVGLRIGVIQGILDVTAEWNLNDFVRLGRTESADEFLLTVHWEMDWPRR